MEVVLLLRNTHRHTSPILVSINIQILTPILTVIEAKLQLISQMFSLSTLKINQIEISILYKLNSPQFHHLGYVYNNPNPLLIPKAIF